MSRFNKLTVKNITRETPNAIVITFEVPENLTATYQFIAGQYVNLKHVIDNKEVTRAYSISSSPHENTLSVTVKEVEGGLFSTFANKKLEVGNTIEVGIPEGRFTIVPNASQTNVYGAIAAGSGITPVISIIKTVLETEPKSKFVLLYGNKSVQETIFYNEINRLVNTYKDRFFVQYAFSQESIEGSLNGRVVRESIQHIFTKNHSENYNKFFICGPEDLVYNSISTLKEMGVNEDNIKFELFTSSEKGSYVPVSSDNTTITVLLDDEEVVFEMSRKDSIIKALNDKGLDAPQSCLGGVCSSCICKITKGEAILAKNSVLTDQEIEAGFTLACQAYPTTNEISIDFDNV